MKDSEFIELLNLYLDHEISPGDAARLESEVQANPARHRVYQDYCRMQKACKLLARDFATEPVADSDQKVVAFEEARTLSGARSRARYVAGAFVAAAACVAFVLVGRYNHSMPLGAPANALVQSSAPSNNEVTPAVATPAATVAVVNMTDRARPDGAQNPFSIRSNGRSQPLMLGSAQNDPNLAWIQDVHFTPVQLPLSADQLRLESNPDLRSESRTYTSGNKVLPSDVRWTAIRFQR